MVLVENNIFDFKNALKKFIKEYDNNETELKTVDSRIIKEIYSIIDLTTNFSVPFNPKKYKKNNEILDSYNVDLNISCSFEFNFDSYSVETFFKDPLVKLPYILFKIVNTDNKLNLLSNITGSEITGDLIFMVRKIGEKWELPLSGVCVSANSVQDFVFFKKLNFEMEISKSKEILLDATNYNKKLLIEKTMQFSLICFNKNETLMANERGLIIPKTFMGKDYVSDKTFIKLEIERNKNGLNGLNSLYDYSIKF